MKVANAGSTFKVRKARAAQKCNGYRLEDGNGFRCERSPSFSSINSRPATIAAGEQYIYDSDHTYYEPSRKWCADCANHLGLVEVAQ